MGPLLDAMRALRVERNPLRARALLIAYLDHHPNGKLSEEALVMLIEAAAGNGDSDAPALAARYLKLYPRGPFSRHGRTDVGGDEQRAVDRRSRRQASGYSNAATTFDH